MPHQTTAERRRRRAREGTERETESLKERFAKVSIVSYSRPSLMIIASASQFHVFLLWGQCPFSIVKDPFDFDKERCEGSGVL